MAIGPDKLAEAFRDGYAGKFFQELVSRYGMSFNAASADNITLDAATELKLRVAVPSTAPPSSGSPSAGSGSSQPASTPSKGGR